MNTMGCIKTVKADACMELRYEESETVLSSFGFVPSPSHECIVFPSFFDDGSGVQSEEMIKTLIKKAKILGKVVATHCEVNSLQNGGYKHDYNYALEH